MKKLGLLLTFFLVITMGSHRVFAQSVTVVLMPGWNWISVPLMDTLDFQTAMGSVTPAVGDIIKSRWGSATYIGDGQWRGTISQFYPGYGYHYKSNRMMPVMLTFTAQQPTSQVVVTTSEPMLITAISAMCGGNVTTSNGDYVSITVRGICWGTHQNPTLNDDFIEVGNSMGDFTATMTDLYIGTTYYVRAYAVTPNGTVYGEEKTFATRDGIPTLTTAEVTNVAKESAICGGDITDNGGLNITDRGVCWSTSPNPTIADQHTVDGSGIGSFSSNITGLNGNTTYYVRAYATNNNTTAYGNEVSFTTLDYPTGAINGMFSVSANRQIYFSQGNLQYQASTNTWRFANNQYDYIGSTNTNISSSYSGWIDLFGWGTSGYNHGAVCYQPWSISQTNSDYYAYGSYTYNLYNKTGKADWGYNPISNGCNAENSGWRTLTRDEWGYVFNTRTTAFGIRYAKAKINNVNGVILLPDDWNTSYYMLNDTNNSGANFSSNIITSEQWQTLEQHGAVFLPVAGFRSGTATYEVDSWGRYWSSSYYNTQYSYEGQLANIISFSDSVLSALDWQNRCYGFSVRLVRNAE